MIAELFIALLAGIILVDQIVEWVRHRLDAAREREHRALMREIRRQP